jgi:glucose-6-phosphate isomerase
VTLSVGTVDAFTVGVLIALFERAVGLYASLVNVNAYHQPGVEAGKKAASTVIELERGILDHLNRNSGKSFSPKEISQAIGRSDEIETVFTICEYLSANSRRGIRKTPGTTPFTASYGRI